MVFRSKFEQMKVKSFIEYCTFMDNLPKKRSLKLKAGDRVHIHSKRGIYTVEAINYRKVTITCRVWQVKFEGGQLPYRRKTITFDEVKCKAG